MPNIQTVETKTINFYGNDLVAVKASNGRIYAGIKWICSGIGLDNRRQKEKIQTHMTLSKGVATLTLPSSGGDQEALTIDIEFVPLWLATINPALVSKEIQGQLIKYQLEAKDVLADAFLKKNKVVPLSKDQALITVLRTTADLVEDNQAIKAEQHQIRKLITQVDDKVESQITLDHGEQRRLQKAVARRVYDLEPDDQARRSKLFREIYRELKDRFAVGSYKDILRRELQDAIRYVEAFIPRRVA